MWKADGSENMKAAVCALPPRTPSARVAGWFRRCGCQQVVLAVAVASGGLANLQPTPAHAQFVQQGSKLVGTGALGPAKQGGAVALSLDGNTAAVGAPFDDSQQGATWIFKRVGPAWTQETKLVGSGAVGAAWQGNSVHLSGDGNTLIVGAPRDDAATGAAWIFVRSGATWTEQAKLVGSGPSGAAQQGWSVALSADGNTAMLGGISDDDTTATGDWGTGAAWVFTRSDTVWTQQGTKLVGVPNTAGSSRQGRAVALSANGDIAVVGGPYDDNNGAAWVFERGAGGWSQASKLTANDASPDAYQGESVAISADGSTVLVGGVFDEFNGAAWVYVQTGGTWAQQGPKLSQADLPGQGSQGASVSLSAYGNTAAVGAPHLDFLISDGGAWSYSRTAGSWSPLGAKLAGTGAVGQAGQGWSIALSGNGNTLIVGGLTDNSSDGAAWVFVRSLPPQGLAILPATGGRDSIVSATITGSGILPGATARLMRGGQSDILGSSVSVAPDGLSLTATFDLAGAAFGLWNVVVTNPFAQTTSLLSGFTVRSFTDVTTGPLGFTGDGRGGAWGDYDNDGDQDLYLMTYGQGNKLLRNDGAGAFVDVSTPLLSGPSTSGLCTHGVWGDHDNDGDLDLYLSFFGANALLRNDGGVFANATSATLADASGLAEHKGAAWADHDGDGDLDLYVVKNNGPNVMLRNDGSGEFTDATSGPLGDAGPGSAVVWGDYDNDGDPDLYLVNWGATSKLLRNDGGGAFVDVTAGPLGDIGYGHAAAWGDYDNDGDLDLFIANAPDFPSPSRLLRNGGGGVFVDAASGTLANQAGNGVAWGDYDLDGDLDLYLARSGQPNALFRNDGGGTFADATLSPLGDPGSSVVPAWADHDNDGDLDLYFGNHGGGSNKLLRNDNSNGNHWLQVNLVGTTSNRLGMGARVHVSTGSLLQVRHVSGGAGNQSQSATGAQFGLGSVTSLSLLEVRWPSGIVQTVSPLPALDQVVVVTESGASTPAIASITPANGGNVAPVTVTIQGSGLPPGLSVRLTRAGQSDIPGTEVVLATDFLSLSAMFNLAGAQVGAWNVVLTTPDLQTALLPNAFTVEALEAPQLRVDLLGPAFIRANYRTAFDIVLANDGNVDATAVPVWLAGIPTDVIVEADFAVAPPPQSVGEPDWAQAPLTLPGAAGKYLSLLIPRVSPGLLVRRVYLTVPTVNTMFELRVGLTPPWGDDPAGLATCLADAGVTVSMPCLGTQLGAITSYAAAHPELAAVNGVGVWAKEAWQCEGASTLAAALAKAEQVLDVLVGPTEQPGTLPTSCADVARDRWRDALVVNVVGAIDPNDKLGPRGIISAGQALPYEIRFENLATASVPAQRVSVVDMLDLTTLDPSTVSLEAIVFDSWQLFPPLGRTQWATVVVLRPDLHVGVGAELDEFTGVLRWNFISIDPATGQPLSPLSLDGFLPPGGQGSVLFTVEPRADILPGAEIRNRASIVFDANPDLLTEFWLNTMDAVPPASQVLPLAATQDSVSFTVRWEASGSPLDLRDYTVYVSDEAGPYQVWKLDTQGTAGKFTTQPGHQYAFYSVARDVSGNIETAPPAPDAQTLALADAPVDGPLRLALEGARPNPARGVVRAWFTLPAAGAASLELIDVSGRRVARQDVSALGPGRHFVTLDGSRVLGAGLYWLRLARGHEVRTARLVLIQ